MSSVRFVCSDSVSDIICSCCGQGLDVDEWRHTEYGEPQQGESVETCCNCGTEFTLETQIVVKYLVK